MKRPGAGSPRLAFAAGTLLALLAAWYVATSATGFIPAVFFPTPAESWVAFRQIAFDGYADGKLHQHFFHSAWLVLMGFAAAVGVGVPLGMAMGWSHRVDAFFGPVFLLIRPIPPLAWIPLAIVWLGLGDAAKVMVIWFAAFVPAVINSYTGVRIIEPHLTEAAHSLGIRGPMLVREVLLPGAAPLIFTGLRLSLQACWTTLVAAELIGAILGLGHALYQAGLDLNPAMIVVGMASVAVAGASMTMVLGAVERHLTPWRAR